MRVRKRYGVGAQFVTDTNCVCVSHGDTQITITSPQLRFIKGAVEGSREKNGESGREKGRKDLNYKKKWNSSLNFKDGIAFLPFHFLISEDYCHIYISHVIPLTRSLKLSWRVFYTVENGENRPAWPTFITLIHNMT